MSVVSIIVVEHLRGFFFMNLQSPLFCTVIFFQLFNRFKYRRSWIKKKNCLNFIRTIFVLKNPTFLLVKLLFLRISSLIFQPYFWYVYIARYTTLYSRLSNYT